MELSDFLINTIPIYVVELLAAFMGIYYLKKTSTKNKSELWLVRFVWIIFIVEILGSYTAAGYFSGYKYFSFIEGTVFQKNRWIYNVFIIIIYSFYAMFFGSLLSTKLRKNVISHVVVIFVITCVFNLLVSDVYFVSISKLSSVCGSIILLLSIFLYFFELLKSEQILTLKSKLPFYISIGLFVWTVCLTPVTILSEYFSVSSGNQLFVNMSGDVRLYSNIFMYLTFALGFYLCSKKK